MNLQNIPKTSMNLSSLVIRQTRWGTWLICRKGEPARHYLLACSSLERAQTLTADYARASVEDVVSKVEVVPFKARGPVKRLPHCYVNSTQLRAGIVDKNDCTVRAYATVTGTPYVEAHKLFADAGRKPGKGFFPSRVLNLLPRFRAVSTSVKCGNYHTTGHVTLSQFIAAHPVGTFYVCTSTHAFAIYDGMTFDSCAPYTGRQKLVEAWEYVEQKAA